MTPLTWSLSVVQGFDEARPAPASWECGEPTTDTGRPHPLASGPEGDEPDVGLPEDPGEHDRRRGLAPPQFSLATLLGVMTLVALVLALSDVIGAYGTFWLIVFVIAVVAHVAGNALGKQLREHGSRPLGGSSPQYAPSANPVHYAPRTRLSEHHSSHHWVVLVTFTGALLGAIGGGYWLVETLGDQFTIGAMAVALIAFAVLGGIWSFLTIGFIYVMVSAWRQSTKHK